MCFVCVCVCVDWIGLDWIGAQLMRAFNNINSRYICGSPTLTIISRSNKPALCAAPPALTLSTKTGLSPDTYINNEFNENQCKAKK